MAISRLQPESKWTEIASTSPTSGTAVSFTSLPSHKELKVIWSDIILATSASLAYFNFNNDSGNNYSFGALTNRVVDSQRYAVNVMESAFTNLHIGRFRTVDKVSGYLYIDGANDILKSIKFANFSPVNTNDDYPGRQLGDAIWNNSAEINRIDLTISSGTFSSGTIKVYGRN